MNWWQRNTTTYWDEPRQIGDKRGESAVLGNLANAYLALGDANHGFRYFQQDFAIAQEVGDYHTAGNALWNLNLLLDVLGERTQAINCAIGALEIFDLIQHQRGAAKVRKQLTEWHYHP
jgi:hypothetical protein